MTASRDKRDSAVGVLLASYVVSACASYDVSSSVTTGLKYGMVFVSSAGRIKINEGGERGDTVHYWYGLAREKVTPLDPDIRIAAEKFIRSYGELPCKDASNFKVIQTGSTENTSILTAKAECINEKFLDDL